jgi:hypothetical protein
MKTNTFTERVVPAHGGDELLKKQFIALHIMFKILEVLLNIKLPCVRKSTFNWQKPRTWKGYGFITGNNRNSNRSNLSCEVIQSTKCG